MDLQTWLRFVISVAFNFRGFYHTCSIILRYAGHIIIYFKINFYELDNNHENHKNL